MVLVCQNNNLTTIPKLPESIWSINLNGNPIRTLPDIPYGLYSLRIKGHNLMSLPVNFPDKFRTPKLLNEIKENVDYRQAQIDAIPDKLVIKDIKNLIMAFL